jgi:sugar lactone lactonase YvrE
MTPMRTETLVTGLAFPEGPRWHDGRLWFSDFYRHSVFSVDDAGRLATEAVVERQPSGLGWLPDGRLLVVSMLDRRLLRRERDGALVEHADLSPVAGGPCNDMVVDARGRAWVGNFGAPRGPGGASEAPVDADLAYVGEDGAVRCAARGLAFPNGSVITPDGRTLVVGETRGARFTAFDIADDGTLVNRRLWASIDPHRPDGCCLDAEGAIWVADPRGRCVVRVRPGGEIVARVDIDTRTAFACMLGGSDGRTLYVCTAMGSGSRAEGEREGRIEAVRVDVPHAGLP